MATTTDHRAVLARIDAAFIECDQQEQDAYAMPHGTNEENAVRSLLIAAVCARKAAWWRVLHRHTKSDATIHHLYRMAVLAAAAEERGHARFWRDAAADWTARAERRPTSGAAGALSNWHELGVSA
jgi:hypothetical protein